MSRVLSIDYGLKRIGLAHSDIGRKFAFPLKVVSSEKFFDEIDELLESIEYSTVLFGIPLRNDGSEGDLATEIRELAEKIKNTYQIEIDFIDEAMSSEAADNLIVSQDLTYEKRKKKRHEKIDSIAAAHFLQVYLDGKNMKK